MIKEVDFIFSPEQLFSKDYVLNAICLKTGLNADDIKEYRVVRKSIDARKGVKYNVRLQYIVKNEKFPSLAGKFAFKNVSNSEPVIIVGAGPAGYFAALQCLMYGFKPIVLDRGKSVDERKHDIAALNREHKLNPDSNYAFGEGGAGTYSDGKLYTRSGKRGDVNLILQLLHHFGADEEILIDSHPHIGTDKLPGIMKSIREQIISCGGDVVFSTTVSELKIKDNAVTGVVCTNGAEYESKHVILATGHSARDVYMFLRNQNVKLEDKGFAMGIRVEHPQELIDSIQYKRKTRGDLLPAATYNLVKQIDGRGVYSFCMCPGGTIVCASTEDRQAVVNGMSNSRRNSPFANSGIVVELHPEDVIPYTASKDFPGLAFQEQLEKMAWQNAASVFKVPAQRLADFVKGKISADLPKSSYFPGLVNSPMHFWLPDIIGSRLRKAFGEFDKQMHGFLTNEAIVTGVESRTSSPVKIVRDFETFMSPGILGLYPCGEGAGYAGGIVSSAIDGMQVIARIGDA
jgi:uncharacterized FAD-dependent dehydrogenase